ncbi:4-galactosyl-N-acetylglucosaminide 3-alpha-L-fucosyltransferase FUT6-like [Ostrinia nubilalis]|uniref:4-galactosyl-N-acetylglucosaminide 3-alpha-L-fucosyltransferase FUT6-like n=1 Tax=Ostrinia nubilalis TaxID=29057 RepID=UPI003082529E
MAIKTRMCLRGNFTVLQIIKKTFIIAVVYVVVQTFIDYVCSREIVESLKEEPYLLLTNDTVTKYYEKRKHWETSVLGAALFKNLPIERKQENRTFVVLVWKYWNWLKIRHLGGHSNDDPLDDCSVKNCIFTSDESQINSVDSVLVHIQHGVFPQVPKRNTSQRWVFLSDESPFNTFSMAHPKPSFSSLANVFNWSMTYRSDSDVPVPYGRTVPLSHSPQGNLTSLSIPYWESKQKDVPVAVLISNCGVTERMNYIRELQRHIDVDIIGKCASDKGKSCPGHFRADCPKINNYQFYLAFENTRCRQYFTEKVFFNAYAKGAIPIVMGPPILDCEKLLPPQSFLHVDDFASPKDLAMKILELSKNEEKLLSFHQWRHQFKVANEHGYFGTKSYHLCRLCEALNFNDKNNKEYDEDTLKLYLEPKLLCTKSNK